MKKALVTLSASALLISCSYKSMDKKYAINYNHGRWGFADYTDTFTIEKGVIKYVDHHGKVVMRYGTFSVTENK